MRKLHTKSKERKLSSVFYVSTEGREEAVYQGNLELVSATEETDELLNEKNENTTYDEAVGDTNK